MLKFIFIMSFVSNFLLINSQDYVISIRFETLADNNISCIFLKPNYALAKGHVFTLDILSHFYIDYSIWSRRAWNWTNILNLKNTRVKIGFTNMSPPTLNYSLQYTEKLNRSHLKLEKWEFKFNLISTENMYPVNGNYNRIWSNCSTTVHLVPNHPNHEVSSYPVDKKGPEVNIVTIILGTISGLTMLVQMVYIIYIKGQAAKRVRAVSGRTENVYTVRERTVNIAERPPLPLPQDAVIYEVPPLPPRSPPNASRNNHLKEKYEQMPMPPPIPGPSPGLYRKPKALPPIIPTPPKGTPVLRSMQRKDSQESTDEEWSYEPLKPFYNY